MKVRRKARYGWRAGTDRIGAEAVVQRPAACLDNVSCYVLNPSFVLVVVRADADRWKPHRLSAIDLRARFFDARHREGNLRAVPGGQLQGRRQIDSLSTFVGCR
jgi:hypothetical protein